MSSPTPSMRKLFALVLAAGLLPVPAAALAEGGHHGHRGHQSHRGHHGHHGGLHLGIRLGHHGLRSGHHYRYGHRRGYAYYSHGYRFPYSGIYGTGPVYRYRENAAKEPAADGATLGRNIGNPYRSAPATGAAWNLLATDRPADALREFGRQAASDPDNGVPKVGYALASAMTGDLTRGVWAMRRALRSHPHSLQYVTINEQLRPKVEHLTHQYEQALDHTTQDHDAAFMVASLHHLLRNTEKAHHAIERAIRDGDLSVSAKNLTQLIEKVVAATATYASGSDRAPVEQSAPDAEANKN